MGCSALRSSHVKIHPSLCVGSTDFSAFSRRQALYACTRLTQVTKYKFPSRLLLPLSHQGWEEDVYPHSVHPQSYLVLNLPESPFLPHIHVRCGCVVTMLSILFQPYRVYSHGPNSFPVIFHSSCYFFLTRTPDYQPPGGPSKETCSTRLKCLTLMAQQKKKKKFMTGNFLFHFLFILFSFFFFFVTTSNYINIASEWSRTFAASFMKFRPISREREKPWLFT